MLEKQHRPKNLIRVQMRLDVSPDLDRGSETKSPLGVQKNNNNVRVVKKWRESC